MTILKKYDIIFIENERKENIMVKGSVAKDEITKKILETFQGSFSYDKEIRIPWVENGEELQIKCTLTCAKVAVCADNVAAVPQKTDNTIGQNLEITQTEKEEVVDLINRLGL